MIFFQNLDFTPALLYNSNIEPATKATKNSGIRNLLLSCFHIDRTNLDEQKSSATNRADNRL